jgi:hypothetical protein
MVTAVDGSVLLDVLLNDPQHAGCSIAALRQAASEGSLMTISCNFIFGIRRRVPDAYIAATMEAVPRAPAIADILSIVVPPPVRQESGSGLPMQDRARNRGTAVRRSEDHGVWGTDAILRIAERGGGVGRTSK